MKTLLAVALALLSVTAGAAPVRVTLRPAAAVQPDASDFFGLAAVADLSGGDETLRAKLASVCVGRAPLSGETREITPGDLALKLRQAGFVPGRDAVICGAARSEVTVAAPPAPSDSAPGSNATPGGAAMPAPTRIRPGTPVTIRVDEDDLSVTATGVAVTSGAAGETIRVRRDGEATELNATVVDAQTVELEP